MISMKTALIGAFSAIFSTLSAYVVYTTFEDFSGMVKLLAMIICGLLIGSLQGFFMKQSQHTAVGIGSFIGLLILWLPVVLATYGFALLALPILAAMAKLVLFGAALGTKLRAHIGKAA